VQIANEIGDKAIIAENEPVPASPEAVK
jgi:hypothetical protein